MIHAISSEKRETMRRNIRNHYERFFTLSAVLTELDRYVSGGIPTPSALGVPSDQRGATRLRAKCCIRVKGEMGDLSSLSLASRPFADADVRLCVDEGTETFHGALLLCQRMLAHFRPSVVSVVAMRKRVEACRASLAKIVAKERKEYASWHAAGGREAGSKPCRG